ncbi:MAG: Maf-like protein [Alphaproteobacteria bacterium]|nr:Maf-like protein [Alphaproteobacteria bacterium]MBV9150924.1 Maf-like protein [Alphaproteobacteria bacterium]MBV9586387.1 Maf-like protein [Alphaproteobacteria bacterium]MBV9966156.1 Maf-like protein [Alphaproteobacteria bacterium]
MAAITPETIILASASPTRAHLLEAAGMGFAVDPANIDEGAIKRRAREAGQLAITCALTLAAEKAGNVSARHPEALVIGADQLLVAKDKWFDKAASLAEAREQLLALRGRTHVLATAVCVIRGGDLLWRATSAPELMMRPFSDAFLDDYIAAEGEALLGSVGAYRLEGRGAQLFAWMTGDHFAVLGLPLFELLEFLRSRGAILS